MKNYKYSFLFLALVFALLINVDRIEKALFPEKTVSITKSDTFGKRHINVVDCRRVNDMQKELVNMQKDPQIAIFNRYSTAIATSGIIIPRLPSGNIDQNKLEEFMLVDEMIMKSRRENIRAEIAACLKKP